MLWVIQRQLKSRNVEARREAAAQLCRESNPRALASLKAALTDEDAIVRTLAATALGKIEDEQVTEPLLAALRDRDAEVVKAAVLALKRSSNPKIVAALEPLLRHSDAAVRGSAVQSLERLGWRPNTQEDEIWQFVAKGQFARAVAFGVPAIAPLESVISSSPSSVRVGAIQALGEIGGARALRPVLAALKSDDPAACVAALDTLGNVGGPEVVQSITTLLRHSNSHIRVAAVDTLKSLRATVALEQIRDLLRDPVWDVRRAAADTLGRLKDKEATEDLTRVLADPDSDVREASAMALGNVCDRRAIGPLVMALKDPNSGVRRISAAALSRIDEDWSSSPEARASFEQLKADLDNEDSDVRNFVGQLLMGLGALEPKERIQEASRELAVSTPRSASQTGNQLVYHPALGLRPRLPPGCGGSPGPAGRRPDPTRPHARFGGFGPRRPVRRRARAAITQSEAVVSGHAAGGNEFKERIAGRISAGRRWHS